MSPSFALREYLWIRISFSFILIHALIACGPQPETKEEQNTEPEKLQSKTIVKPSLIVLGNVQDGGAPHINCQKACCKGRFENPDENLKVVSLGLVEPETKKSYLFEASPDLITQLRSLSKLIPNKTSDAPDGLFLTHAHIGHYSGLMYLGKEAMNANQVKVYAMPRMSTFLSTNGPWDQLINNQNILLQELYDQESIELSAGLKVTPFTVLHRDEYSETVGYIIEGPNKKALFIPDIDKWEKWEKDINQQILEVDYAFIDATFFDAEEINYRDISEIPHPFVIESIKRFSDFNQAERGKIHFIHMNHTNPLLDPNSKASKEVLEKGFNIARMNDQFEL